MNCVESMVKKLRIFDIEDLEPITTYIENFEIGAGKITIECFGDCWSYGWYSMGETNLENFFLNCENDYLIKKLFPGINREFDDFDNLDEHLKYLSKIIYVVKQALKKAQS